LLHLLMDKMDFQTPQIWIETLFSLLKFYFYYCIVCNESCNNIINYFGCLYYLKKKNLCKISVIMMKLCKVSLLVVTNFDYRFNHWFPSHIQLLILAIELITHFNHKFNYITHSIIYFRHIFNHFLSLFQSLTLSQIRSLNLVSK